MFRFLMLFFIGGFIFSSPSYDSEEHEEFTVVKYNNNSICSLFPDQFTAEQIGQFFQHKPVSIDGVGEFAASVEFQQKIMPYTFQVFTGTASRYASKIRFVQAVEVEDNKIYGSYVYTSSYGAAYRPLGYTDLALFTVTLSLGENYTVYNFGQVKGKCRIFNMKESVLGDKDFVSSPVQLNPQYKMIPNASIYFLKGLDRGWVDQTPSTHRVEQNIKCWLQVLHQLKGEGLYEQTEDMRKERAEELYRQLIQKHGYDATKMTKETYADCLMAVRAAIFDELGIAEELIPAVEGPENIIALHEGRLFFVVP